MQKRPQTLGGLIFYCRGITTKRIVVVSSKERNWWKSYMTKGVPQQARRYKLVSIAENREFKRVYARGKSYVSPMLVTYVLKNRGKHLRVGITASKKVGNAVKRNRSRRVIRAALLSLLPQIDTSKNVDFIFVARGKTPYVKSTAVAKAMKKQLKEAGYLV